MKFKKHQPESEKTSTVFAKDQLKPVPKICLNMIVKNESHVICRSLASVKAIINYWVIVDTGSTDGTQAAIQDFLKDVPGELHERKWVDFAHNRNEALKLAYGKGDYVLFIDADQVLQFESGFELPHLDKDLYLIQEIAGDERILKMGLINNSLQWVWVGSIHEELHLLQPQELTHAFLQKIVYTSPHDGCRSQDPEKLQKDRVLLEEAIKKEPNNPRHYFYLAMTLAVLGESELSLKHFAKRISFGNDGEEVFWSMLHIAMLQESLQMPESVVTESYFKTYKQFPMRVEPIYYLANYYRRAKNYKDAYLFARGGLTIEEPQEALFVKSWIYEYGCLFEFLQCALALQKYDEAQVACQKLLSNPNLPANIRKQVQSMMSE